MVLRKGVKISIIVLLSVILTAGFCLAIFKIFNKPETQARETSAVTQDVIDDTYGIVYLNKYFANNLYYCCDPTADYYNGKKTVEGVEYTFKPTSVDYFSNKKIIVDEIYEEYDTYIIEDKEGLQVFADNVWNINPTSALDGGGGRYRSFLGKTVKLANNINWGKNNFTGIGWMYGNSEYANPPGFNGTFDGCWKTISNVVLSGEYKCSWLKSGLFSSVTYDYVGFFNCIYQKAVIKNLRLYQCSSESYKTTSTTRAYVGGLVGLARGNDAFTPVIDSCSIEDFNGIFADNNAQAEYVASIVCKGKVTIQNCYVELCYSWAEDSGLTVTNFNHIGPFGKDNQGSSYWYNTDTGASIIKCVVNNYIKGYLYNLSDGQYYVENTYVYWDPVGDYPQKGLWNSSNGLVASSSFGNLDVSYLGGETGSMWYYYEKNDAVPAYRDMPYLRQFIDAWTTFYIDDNQDADYYKIQIANRYYDGKEISYYVRNFIDNNKTNREINVCGYTIKAAQKEGYTFTYWYIRTNLRYQANYEADKYTFNFAKIENYAPSVSSVVVQYNKTIEVSVSYFLNETVIKYVIGTNVITYSLPLKYTIKSWGDVKDTGGSTKFTISNNVTIPKLVLNATYSITPTIELKSYNSTFS